jgi:hypothetical protein
MVRFVSLCFALCALAAPALAGGNVCVEQGAVRIVLTKPKLPKVLNSAPLHGFFEVANNPPLHGTLMLGTTGTVRAAFTYTFADGVTCFGHVAMDATFEGAGSARCTNDLADEIPLVWTRVDC